MITLKYDERIKAIKDLVVLRGNTLLVEVLPKTELKSTGGIIMAKVDTHRATAEDYRRSLGVVILVGDESTEIKAGEVVMLPSDSLYLSEFPGLADYTQQDLAIVREDGILLKYADAPTYAAAQALLNASRV